MAYYSDVAPRDIVRGGRESYNAYDGRYEVDDSSVRTAKFYIPEEDHEDVFRTAAVPMAQTASNGGCGAGWSSPGRAYPYASAEQVQPIAYGRDASGYSSRSSSIGWAEHEQDASSRDWHGETGLYPLGTPEPYGADPRYDHAYGAVGGQRKSTGHEVQDVNSSSRAYPYYAAAPQHTTEYAVQSFAQGPSPSQTAEYDPYHQYARQTSPVGHLQQQVDHFACAPTESPIRPPLNPSPEEALAQSGVNLSNWLAETVWTMLLIPFHPGKPTEQLGTSMSRSRNNSQDLPTPPNAYPVSAGRFNGPQGTLDYKKSSADDFAYYSSDSGNGSRGDLSPYYRLSIRPPGHISSGHGSPIHISPPITPYRQNLIDNPYGLHPRAPQSFANFIYRTLSQTLLSPAAVVLAVWYMRRLAVHTGGGENGAALRQMLRDAMMRPDGKAGEEVARRLVVLGLACSNKWLDDNTFTNKSWSDVTHLPLLELNRLEMHALSPREINFDLSVSQLEWQLWVEQVERSVSGPFVTDARLVRDAIHTLFYPALEASRRRFARDVEGPRMAAEEQEREEQHRLEVERMLAVAAEEARRDGIARLNDIAREAVWAKQQQALQVHYQQQASGGMPAYYDDRADNGGWGRDFAPSGYRGERFGSTGSNASSGYGSARSAGTPQVQHIGIGNAQLPAARTSNSMAALYAPEPVQRAYPVFHSDPWLYRQQPAGSWRDDRRGMIAA